MKKKIFDILLSSTALLVLVCALSISGLTSCSDDLGLCTITTTGDDLLYPEISINECQDHFVNTAGARGWSWDPKD